MEPNQIKMNSTVQYPKIAFTVLFPVVSLHLSDLISPYKTVLKERFLVRKIASKNHLIMAPKYAITK